MARYRGGESCSLERHLEPEEGAHPLFLECDQPGNGKAIETFKPVRFLGSQYRELISDRASITLTLWKDGPADNLT